MKITTALRRKIESYVASAKSKGTTLGWKKHLRSWPAYAAAGASSLAIVSSAGAGIISSGPLDVIVGAGGTPDHRFTAKIQIGSATFNERASNNPLHPTAASGPNAFGHISLSMFPNTSKGRMIDKLFSSASMFQPKRFSSGAVISQNAAGSRFSFGTVAHKSYDARPFHPNIYRSTRGTWPVNQPGFIGIELNQPDGIHYGWVKFKWGADADSFPNSATILGWAYNDVAGAPIRAGEVPEPGAMTIAILGAGCAGVLALRRRRRERTNAEAAS